MNLLYVGHELDLNGSGYCLLNIVKYMISCGHKVWVVLPRKKIKINGLLDDQLIKLGANIIYCRSIKCWVANWKKYKFFKYLKHIIKTYLGAIYVKFCLGNTHIDIVHTNTSITDFGAVLASVLGSRHVWHFRENLFKMDCVFNYPDKDINFINTKSDAVVFVSNTLYNYFKNYIDAKLCHVIYDGIELDDNSNKELNELEKKNFNILITGVISELKGQKIAIESVANLVERGYNNVFLYLAGSGNSDSFEKMITDKKVQNNIKFLGYVNDMKTLRNKINVELSCSSTEGFGLVVVEAMTMGIPVIVSDSEFNAANEIIKNNESGFVFKHDNPVDLADKIEYCINNYDKVKLTIGENAKLRAQDFSLTKNCKNLEFLYGELISYAR